MPIILNFPSGNGDIEAHIKNKENPHSVTKEQVGLGNVNNTADADKPISTAVQSALNNKAEAAALTNHINDTAKHLPSGGTTGYLLAKSGSGGAEWRPPMSNPNLLDNWYFINPINQKGITEYKGFESMYAIDRWLVAQYGTAISLSVGDNGITIYDNELIGQKLEDAILSKIVGQVLTFSVMLSNGKFYSGTAKFQFGADLYFVSNNSDIVLLWWHNGGGYFAISIYAVLVDNQTIKAAKLELGSQQTLAHQDENGNWVLNDPPPNKALELAKCQRYQLSLFRQNGFQGYIGPLQSNGGTEAWGMIYTPVTLCKPPTIIVSDYARLTHWFSGGQPRTVSKISACGYTANQVQVQVTFDGDVPAGYCGYLCGNPQSDDLLIIDANL